MTWAWRKHTKILRNKQRIENEGTSKNYRKNYGKVEKVCIYLVKEVDLLTRLTKRVGIESLVLTLWLKKLELLNLNHK